MEIKCESRGSWQHLETAVVVPPNGEVAPARDCSASPLVAQPCESLGKILSEPECKDEELDNEAQNDRMEHLGIAGPGTWGCSCPPGAGPQLRGAHDHDHRNADAASQPPFLEFGGQAFLFPVPMWHEHSEMDPVREALPLAHLVPQLEIPLPRQPIAGTLWAEVIPSSISSVELRDIIWFNTILHPGLSNRAPTIVVSPDRFLSTLIVESAEADEKEFGLISDASSSATLSDSEVDPSLSSSEGATIQRNAPVFVDPVPSLQVPSETQSVYWIRKRKLKVTEPSSPQGKEFKKVGGRKSNVGSKRSSKKSKA